MKALLIGINTKYIHPAIALYQLRANTSYDVDILEFNIKNPIEMIKNKIFSFLSRHNCQLIGFSCYLWNIENILILCSVIKQNFPTKIMLGGPEVAYDAKYFLSKYPFIDFVTKAEGEDSFHELLEYLDNKRNLENVCNLCYILNNQYHENLIKVCNLNKIKLATLMTKDLENQVIYLESSRGCPYHCSYCTASLDNHVRFFPLESILNILSQLMKKKAKTVKFLDRTFNANKTYMLSILDHINKNNICTTFQFEIVMDKLDDETINFVNNLNYKFIRFEVGIQTINDEINHHVNRTQNIYKIRDNIIKLQNADKVDIHVDLIAGLPGETKDSFKRSFNFTFLLKCKEVQLGFLKFLRGTKLLDEVDKYNYVYNDTPPYEIISNNTISKLELDEIRRVEKGLNCYYNSGRFKSTFNFLFNNEIITDYYDFFLKLYKGLSNKQLIDSFTHLDTYFYKNFPSYYDALHFNLIQDYLMINKVKPKKWWKESLSKKDKQKLYSQITKIIPSANLDILYTHSTIITFKNYIFLIIYINFSPTWYKIII